QRTPDRCRAVRSRSLCETGVPRRGALCSSLLQTCQVIVNGFRIERLEVAEGAAEAAGGGLFAAQGWAGPAHHPALFRAPMRRESSKSVDVEVGDFIIGAQWENRDLLDLVGRTSQLGWIDEPPHHVRLGKGGLCPVLDWVSLRLIDCPEVFEQA